MDKSKSGIVVPGVGMKPDAQEKLLREAGVEYIRTLRGSWRSLFTGVRFVRPGDVVHFVALAFLPTLRGGDELSPSMQAQAFVHELIETGAVGIEVYTGRKTSNKGERQAMIKDAANMLRKGHRKPPAGYKKTGRPGIVLSAEQKREYGRVWKSKDYDTNEDALKAMGDPPPFNAVTANKLFGPSGRKPGARPRTK